MRSFHSRAWRSAPLRRRFLVTLFVGAVLPLALIGLWLTRSASRAGETLLREQLGLSLQRMAAEVEGRWVHRRSDLLLLAENDAVRQALRQRAILDPADHAVRAYLESAYASLQPTIERVVYRDAAGATRWTLTADPARIPHLERADGDGPTGTMISSASSSVPVRFPVRDGATGSRIGEFEAFVRTSSLLPMEIDRAFPGAAVLAAIDHRTGVSLLPIPLDPALLASPRFDWKGDRWLAVRHRLAEPPLALVLAAPLDPYVASFERTARRGAAALGIVALFVGVATVTATHGMTASLDRLATAARAVSRGDLEHKVRDTGDDQVGEVARVFNSMIDNLQRTLVELSQRQALAAVGEFATALAHEVRNPLTAVRIDVQRIEEKLPVDSPLRAPVADVLAAVERLDRTVSGSLRVARSGRVHLDPIDFGPVLESAVHAAAPQFAARRVTLEPLPKEVRDIRLRGDTTALGQLFLNLLLNAAQAGEAGDRAGVEVASENCSVTVVVWDTGRGIRPADLDRIFDPFFTTRSEGTGLGMTIAQRIALAHGGRIDVRSTIGIGTRVTVRLPIDGADAVVGDGGPLD